MVGMDCYTIPTVPSHRSYQSDVLSHCSSHHSSHHSTHHSTHHSSHLKWYVYSHFYHSANSAILSAVPPFPRVSSKSQNPCRWTLRLDMPWQSSFFYVHSSIPAIILPFPRVSFKSQNPCRWTLQFDMPRWSSFFCIHRSIPAIFLLRLVEELPTIPAIIFVAACRGITSSMTP